MATEQRLIWLDDAKKLFDDITPYIGMTGKCVQEMLDEAPTVDAVEVVHCEDCFADGCCSIQIDLDMGGHGYCPKGRRTDGQS